MRHRVVITGIGWVTPLGHDIEGVWSRLLAGESGIGPISHFDASTFPTTFAAQVKDYDYRDFVRDPSVHEGVGLNSAFALGAASLAWRSAGLDAWEQLDRERLGIYLGSGEGSLDFDNYVTADLMGWNAEQRKLDGPAWAKAASQRLSAIRELEQEPNMPLAHLAMEFEAYGPAYNCLTACAASTQALGEATLNGRDGFVLGEGSGMLILETLEHAQARGANVLAEVVGYGSSADAYRITDIHPEGRGAVASMRWALEDAGVRPEQIDYISAHGTGTKENDSIETKAVKLVFGDGSGPGKAPPVSSVKSMLGHLIAAAGAVEAITCVLAIRDGMLPPTMNLHQPDPACDLDYVANQSRRTPVKIALSNSFGFGGQNDTLVLRAW